MTQLAKIITDSVAPSMCRLTTIEFRLPKCLLAEFNTHRMLSRNAASSRAIPVWKVLRQVMEDPYIPHFGINKPGMQAGAVLEGEWRDVALKHWLKARDHAVEASKYLSDEDWWWWPEFKGEACMRGGCWLRPEDIAARPKDYYKELGAAPLLVHKQTANRLLEPFMKVDVVASATDWQNVWFLRDHFMAHPDIQEPIRQGHELYKASKPVPVQTGMPHLPYMTEGEKTEAADIASRLGQPGGSWGDKTPEQVLERLVKCSVARCARTSLENQDGKINVEKDIELYDRLENPDPNDPDPPMHASPFEHVAFAMAESTYVEGLGLQPSHKVRSGNFRGFIQHRKQKPREVRSEPLWDFKTGLRTDAEVEGVQFLVPAGAYLRNLE